MNMCACGAKTHTCVYISEAEAEQVNSSSFLGISVTENFLRNDFIIGTWTSIRDIGEMRCLC